MTDLRPHQPLGDHRKHRSLLPGIYHDSPKPTGSSTFVHVYGCNYLLYCIVATHPPSPWLKNFMPPLQKQTISDCMYK